jgi:2-polyprenyl-3-methyl-5-hydroxy-6-metoxy-1,4-benzoquinol methylase
VKVLDRLLASSKLYEGSRRLIGAESEMRKLLDRVVKPTDGMRILDFGCGNGRLVPFVAGAEYVGVDNNSSYIDSATAEHAGPKVQFHCADLDSLASLGIDPVDVVVCIGVLHHLDDSVAAKALSASHDLLKPEGRLITMDPCFEPSQHSVARVLMALDRGKFVRHPEGYRSLISENFITDSESLWTDVYKFPYTHFVTESRPKHDVGVGPEA